MNYRTDIEIADEIERQNQADISELALLRRGLVDEQQRRIVAEREADQIKADYLETREQLEQAERQRDDLAMLVKRMSRFVPANMAAQATDYLMRQNLQGSPLRSQSDAVVKP